MKMFVLTFIRYCALRVLGGRYGEEEREREIGNRVIERERERERDRGREKEGERERERERGRERRLHSREEIEC